MTTTKTKERMISDASGGQCRLGTSGSSLQLLPYNGNQLIINSISQTVPSAGVTLAPPATNATLYYIYAYMSGATMTLEASTTGYAVQSTTGVAIKSGDATRTLVGMAYTVSSAWVSSPTAALILSYFNRRDIIVQGASANTSTTSGSSVDLSSGQCPLPVLNWGDEGIVGTLQSQESTTGTYTAVYVDIDGATPLYGAVVGMYGGSLMPSTIVHSGTPAEGFHQYGFGGFAGGGGVAAFYNITLVIRTKG